MSASPSAVRRYKARRNRQVVELFGSGVPVEVIAKKTVLTQRSVKKILKTAGLAEAGQTERK